MQGRLPLISHWPTGILIHQIARKPISPPSSPAHNNPIDESHCKSPSDLLSCSSELHRHRRRHGGSRARGAGVASTRDTRSPFRQGEALPFHILIPLPPRPSASPASLVALASRVLAPVDASSSLSLSSNPPPSLTHFVIAVLLARIAHSPYCTRRTP